MLVIDIALQLHNPERAYFKRRLTFFAATLVLVIPLSYWLVRMLNSAGGVKPYHGGTALSNLLAVSQIMIEYVRLYCFNFHYVADYPIRLYTSTSDWQSWMYILLNVSLIAAAAVSLIKRHYILPIFIAWHYIFVLPVSHIFPISQTLADRYAFMSSLSWCVLLGYILTAVGYKHLNYRRLSPNLPMLAAAAAVVLIASAYSMMSFKQTFVWRDSKSLWENTISRFSNSNPANVNLSVVYISEGKLEEAQKLCVNAIKEMPYDYYAISNLALAQMLMRQYDNAIHNYYAVLALKPDMEKPKLGIANCYWEKGDWKSTYYAYLEVIKSGFTLEDTAYAGLTYSRMAFCAYKIGKRAESEIFINKAATIADRHPESLTTLIDVATTMGRRDIAMKSYRHLYSVLTDPSSRQIVRERMEKYGSE
jgi:tetratricopeptide (TPR) repeat protein